MTPGGASWLCSVMDSGLVRVPLAFSLESKEVRHLWGCNMTVLIHQESSLLRHCLR